MSVFFANPLAFGLDGVKGVLQNKTWPGEGPCVTHGCSWEHKFYTQLLTLHLKHYFTALRKGTDQLVLWNCIGLGNFHIVHYHPFPGIAEDRVTSRCKQTCNKKLGKNTTDAALKRLAPPHCLHPWMLMNLMKPLTDALLVCKNVLRPQ